MSRIRWVGVLALCLPAAACASSRGLPSLYTAEAAPVRLAPGADTRSADAFYRHGTAVIERNPAEAANAFLWASALDPVWAAPVFARRMALLMDDTEYFDRYLSNQRTIRSDPRTLHLDSMYMRALQLSPLLDRSLEATAFRYMIAENYKRRVQASQPGAFVDEVGLSLAIDEYLRRGGPATRAWVAHAEGRYAAAAELYRAALRNRRDRDAVDLRIDYARVLFRLGDHAGAIEELGRALATMREDESDRLVRVYRSKALLEYSLGIFHEESNNPARARDHYASALQEDLAYFQPHLRIAVLSAAEGDTATARAAYRLAVDIAPENALVLYSAGRGLAATGDGEEAEGLLRRLIEVHPHFAAPRFALATILDQRGDEAGAGKVFREFLEMASRTDPNRRAAQARLDALARTAGVTP